MQLSLKICSNFTQNEVYPGRLAWLFLKFQKLFFKENYCGLLLPKVVFHSVIQVCHTRISSISCFTVEFSLFPSTLFSIACCCYSGKCMGDYPFSAYAKFPEDLYFLAPDMHTHVCVCVCVCQEVKNNQFFGKCYVLTKRPFFSVMIFTFIY